MEKTTIEAVNSQQVEQLQKISKQTFYEAYANNNSDENIQQYLNENLSVNKLADEINDPNSEFYFAKYGETIIGFLKLNFGEAQTDIKDERALEIERIYILKEFYGKNVSQLLFQKGLQVAKQKQLSYIWLGVWEKNQRAISFYKKNGFEEFSTHLFKLGDDEQLDILMKLELAS